MDSNDPEPSKQVEDGIEVKKKRRKRGKAKKYTHYKLGSAHGRPRKINVLKPEDVATGLEFQDNGSPKAQTASHEQLESAYTTAESLIEPTQTASESPEISERYPGAILPEVVIKHSCIQTELYVMPGEHGELHVSNSDLPPAFQRILVSAAQVTQASLSAVPSPTPVKSTDNIPSKSDAEVYVAPMVELVNSVISKLQRKVHLPWIVIPEDDGFNVMLLSRGKDRTVQRRAFFAFDGSEEISVHQKTPSPAMVSYVLEKENSDKICLTVECEEQFVDRIVTVVRKFKSCEVCVGVDEETFKPLWEIDEGGEVDKNSWCEARYKETFRNSHCDLLVSTAKYFRRRCQVCIDTKTRFGKRLLHHTSAESSPNTPNIHLTREQLIAKMNKQQKDLAYAKAQIKKLKDKLGELIDKAGVVIDEDLSDDLCSILKDSNLSPVQALFFEEQMKAIDVKNACGCRWHPTLIRFALLLRTTSGAADRAIQDSGVLVLPSEQILYDYSHVVPLDSGCTKDQVDQVAKQVCNEYPESYQSYHVLLMDEMYIKQKLVYLKSTGEIVGMVNLSEAEKELTELEAELNGKEARDSVPLASNILCYMVRGVASGVAEVVALYATLDALDCEKLYDLTWEVIGALERSELRVIAIVRYGTSIDRAFYAMHVPITKTSSGVIFDTSNLCAPERPLYFFSYSSHLLKTIRNCFYNSGAGPESTRLLTKNGQVITWGTIRKLYEDNKKNTGRRCFKLNSNNVDLNAYTIMKVSYAAQVLSKTVALDLKSRKWPGTEETIKFIEKVNDFFDTINGAGCIQDREKSNPNFYSYSVLDDKRFEELEGFLVYLNNWKSEVERKTGYSKSEKAKLMLSPQTLDGIEITVRALIGATRFLLNDGVKSINASVFCQDPLERYFAKQRQNGGSNRNPTEAANFFRNDVKIALHRDMIGNVVSETRGVEVSEEPLSKRQRCE